jgi:hypothetical protein
MKSNISVYLYPDTIIFFKDNVKLLETIEKDTNTKLSLHSRKYDPYISIEGDFENYHQARIILQEIEKNNYSKAVKKAKKSEEKI